MVSRFSSNQTGVEADTPLNQRGALTTKCKSPRVSKGDTLNIEHIALAYARAFACYAGAEGKTFCSGGNHGAHREHTEVTVHSQLQADDAFQ